MAGGANTADYPACIPRGDGCPCALTVETGYVQAYVDFGGPPLSALCVTGRIMYIPVHHGNVHALADQPALAAPRIEIKGL